MGKASIPKPSMEEEIGEAVRTMPRLPRHQPEEFETPRPPIEYAPPATREDFVEAAAAASLELPAERIIEARVRDCLMQRDNAVAEASELRGVLSSLGAILVGYYKPERHNGEAPQSEGNEHVPVPSQAAS